MRKTGQWMVCLSGLISTQAIHNQYYLDRQGHLEIFHKKVGLIITGANSKRQPELATFSEKLLGQVFHMPISSRLEMGEEQDRLSLAYNTFFSDLYVSKPSASALQFHFSITGRGRPAEDAQLTLQLYLKQGEALVTGTGRKIMVGRARIDLTPADLGGSILHRGWILNFDPTAYLVWPIYPHNPYTDAPENSVDHRCRRVICSTAPESRTRPFYPFSRTGDSVLDRGEVTSADGLTPRSRTCGLSDCVEASSEFALFRRP